MRETNTPFKLLEFVMQYVCDIRNYVPSHIIDTKSRTPHELVHNESPDISECTSFRWFDMVWFWNPTQFQKQNLGRWIGVAHSFGSGHVYYVLTGKGNIVTRSTISRLSEEELDRHDVQDMIKKFKGNIKAILGDYDDI